MANCLHLSRYEDAPIIELLWVTRSHLGIFERYFLDVVGIVRPRSPFELKNLAKTRMVELRSTEVLKQCRQRILGPTRRHLWQPFREYISHRLIAETRIGSAQ